MNKIKPTVFKITKEEIEDIFFEMVSKGNLKSNSKLTNKQIVNILGQVECDEFLVKDIRRSIKNSIEDVVV